MPTRSDINLLPEKDVSKEKQAKFKKRLTIFSVVSLIVTLVLVIGVFSYWGILTRQQKQIKNSISNNESTIKNFQKEELATKLLKAKIVSIASIVEGRPDFAETLSDMQSLIPEGVGLTDLSITKDFKVSLSGNARSSADLSNFLVSLIDEQKGGKIFSNVNINALSGDDQGRFKFSLTMELVKVNKQ